MTNIPRVTEGQDLFDDQAFSHAILTNREPTAEQLAAKEQVVTSITRSLVNLGIEERDVEEIILYRFGVFLTDMGSEQLLEVKDWIEHRLVVQVH